MDDLKNMVKWFKLPSDPALPQRRQELIERHAHMKLRTMTGTVLHDAAPMTTDSIPAFQALMNTMALGLASVMNLMALGLASEIGPVVVAPAPVLAHAVDDDAAPTVAADIAPAFAAGFTLSVAAKDNLYATAKDECLIVNDNV
jgi:hypothetical protein